MWAIKIWNHFVKEFFEKNPAPSAERSIKQSLESIKLNIEQLNRDLPEIQQFLEAYWIIELFLKVNLVVLTLTCWRLNQ